MTTEQNSDTNSAPLMRFTPKYQNNMKLSDASLDEIFTEIERRNQLVIRVVPASIKAALEGEPFVAGTDENVDLIMDSGRFFVGLKRELRRALPEVVAECVEKFEDVITDKIIELESICLPYLNLETGEEEYLPGFTQEQRQAARDQIQSLMIKQQAFIDAVDGVEDEPSDEAGAERPAP